MNISSRFATSLYLTKHGHVSLCNGFVLRLYLVISSHSRQQHSADSFRKWQHFYTHFAIPKIIHHLAWKSKNQAHFTDIVKSWKGPIGRNAAKTNPMCKGGKKAKSEKK